MFLYKQRQTAPGSDESHYLLPSGAASIPPAPCPWAHGARPATSPGLSPCATSSARAQHLQGNTGVEARGMFSAERCGRTAYLQGAQKRKKKNLFVFWPTITLPSWFLEGASRSEELSWAGGALRRHHAQRRASRWGDVGQAGRGGRTAELLTCPRSCSERAGSPQGITLLCPCEGAKRLPVGAPHLRGWAASFPASHALQNSLPHPGSDMNPYQSAERRTERTERGKNSRAGCHRQQKSLLILRVPRLPEICICHQTLALVFPVVT